MFLHSRVLFFELTVDKSVEVSSFFLHSSFIALEMVIIQVQVTPRGLAVSERRLDSLIVNGRIVSAGLKVRL